jgi:Ca-activated chloride channel family protein
VSPSGYRAWESAQPHPRCNEPVKSLLLAVLLLLQAVISVHTELVAVPVVVTDGRGHRVTGLNQDDFRVFDDGRPQPIAAFHHGDAPITLGLIVDRSRSMRSKTAALRTAVSALLGSSRPDDELFAIAFNDTVSLALAGDQLFTGNAEELQTALSAVPAEGLTALYDGVAEGLQRLQLGHAGQRALIVVSDGGDNASRRTYDGILALARRPDAVIYAISTRSVSSQANGSTSARSERSR